MEMEDYVTSATNILLTFDKCRILTLPTDMPKVSNRFVAFIRKDNSHNQPLICQNQG